MILLTLFKGSRGFASARQTVDPHRRQLEPARLGSSPRRSALAHPTEAGQQFDGAGRTIPSGTATVSSSGATRGMV